MVGGTIFHRDVIQREISRALVLNLSGKTRCSGTAEEIFVLDNAVALIEGQPPLIYLTNRAQLGSALCGQNGISSSEILVLLPRISSIAVSTFKVATRKG